MKPEAANPPGHEAVVNPWLVAASVMLTTFMVVLDTSVANVAIPHIAGNLSATNEEAIWVLTSYLMANAIVLPATGWISRIFGRKRFLLFCIALFTGSSCLCGLSPSLGILIVARVLQGAGGGAMQPISQAILLESFPRERRGTAMAVFSLGVVVAPIIGPTLGGWITDSFSWRWIFLINLPIGALSMLMVEAFVFDPHHIRKHLVRVIDYWGLAFMVLWLALLQIVLDKGQQEDWFNARWICVATAVSASGMVAFLVREALTKHPIVDLRILKDRNFSIGCALTAVTATILFGSTATLPLYLQELMGYTAFLAGIALSPRGVGALLMSSTLGRYVARCDARYLIAAGFLVLGVATYWLSEINLEVSYRDIAIPVFLSGLAISLIFVPLTTITMGTLPNEEIGNATSIFNLMRNLGGSLGISAFMTSIVRLGQRYQNNLVGDLSYFGAGYQARLHALQHALSHQVGDWLGRTMGEGMLYRELLRQARLLAFLNGFRLMAIMAFACIPFVFLFKRPRYAVSGTKRERAGGAV